MLQTYDVRVSTSPKGYRRVTNALDEMTHIKSAAISHLPNSQMPRWCQPIQDELWEAADGGSYALFEAASSVMLSARDLKDTMKVLIRDDYGVIFGWDGIDLDEEDPATASLLLFMELDDEPFETVRVAGIDDFKETKNGHGEPYYGIGVEPTIETYYPKDWFERNRLLTRPEDVDLGETRIECDVEVTLDSLIELEGHEAFEKHIAKLIANDAVMKKMRTTVVAAEDGKVRLHVTATVER